MKVGEYVRTKNCNMPSLIGKIIKEEYMTPCNAEHKYIYLIDTKDNNVWFEEDNILKSSPNIIDLIQVGDYVNGWPVVKHAYTRDLYTTYVYVGGKGFTTFEDYCNELKKEDEDFVETIVTKEQFEQMSYKVGD